MSDMPPTFPSTSLPLHPPPPPPRVPDHELIRRIGRGAYGEVWLGRCALGTYRAVKVVHRSSFDHDRPFEREFEGIRRFEPVSRTHDSQVDILHVGRADDSFYYVMELADDQATGGQINPDAYAPRTLKSDLMFQGRLPFEECVRIGIALTTALEHLHAHGLVHRDVKPSNIIFVNGVPKLADIGLVTGVDATRSYVGTEGFAPPEGTGTPQADLYSLGKVLYEAATGKDRQEFPELPTQLRELPDREGLVELNAVIARACRHDPKDRYASAAAMRADLELLQSGKSLARLRKTEARLQFVQRAGAAVTALAALIAAGWLWQARQTHLVRDLAAEKSRLADENRQRLVRQRVANGVRLMNEGDLNMSLLWFAEALPLVEAEPQQAQIHRIRLGSLLSHAPRLLYVLPHEEGLRRCWFSPDSQWLLTMDRTSARVWRISDGRLVAPPFRHISTLRQCGFSAQGTEVFTRDDNGILRVWDSAQAWQPRLLRSNVTFCAWQPGGRALLACASNGPAALVEGATGQVLHALAQGEAEVFSGAFSEDGHMLATADTRGEVRIWSAETGQSLGAPIVTERPLTNRPSSILSSRAILQFDRTGRRLLILSDPGQARAFTVQVWDWAEGRRLVGPFRGNSGVIGGAALSSDGTRLALVNEHDHEAGESGAIEIWDIAPGKLVRTLSGYISGNGAFWGPQPDTLAASSWDGFAQLWNCQSGQALTPPLWHSAWLLDVAFTADGRLLATAGDDGLVKLWRLPLSRSETVRFVNPAHDDHPASILSAAISRDGGHIACGACDGKVRVWRVTSGQIVRELTIPIPSPIWHVEWGADGRRLLGVTGRNSEWSSPKDSHPATWRAFVWKLDDQPIIPLALAGTNRVEGATFSPDGQCVATVGTGGANRIWRADSGEPCTGELPHPASAWCVAFSPDGQRLVTGAADGFLRAWDARSGRLIFEKPAHRKSVRHLQFGPDGRRIVTVGNDQFARVWDAATGHPIGPGFKHGGLLFLADWSPDGQRLITSGLSHDVKTWEAVSGQTVLPMMSHTLGLTRIRYSADGQWVASASSDHFAKMWDAATAEPVIVPVNHGQPASEVLFLEDGRRLFTAGEDGTGRILDLTPVPFATEGLRDYARAVCSHDIDSFEAIRKLNKDQVVEAMRRVRAQCPEFFVEPWTLQQSTIRDTGSSK